MLRFAISRTIGSGETGTLAKSGSTIADAAGNQVPDYSGFIVTNNRTNIPTILNLVLSERGNYIDGATDEELTTNGSSTATSLSCTSGTVSLTLVGVSQDSVTWAVPGRRIRGDETCTLSYTGTGLRALDDNAALATFSGRAVSNDSEITTHQAVLCADGKRRSIGSCPAVLSSPVAVVDGQNAADVTFDSTRSDGTNFCCTRPSASSAFSDPADVVTCSEGIALSVEGSPGTQTIDVTGLASDTSYFTECVNRTTQTWLSNIVKTPNYNTVASGDDPNSQPTWNGTCDNLTWEFSESISLDLDTCWTDSDGDALTHSNVSALPTGFTQGGDRNKDLGGTAGTGPENVTATFGATDDASETVGTSITSSLSVQSETFTAQTGTFSFQYDFTPVAQGINSVCGLSDGTPTGFSDLSTSVRFFTDDFIDVRGGGGYANDDLVAYTASVAHTVVMTVNVAANTYSVSIDGNGIADTYDFRTGAEASSLDTFACLDGATPGTTGSTIDNMSIPGAVVQATTTLQVFTADGTPPDPPAAPTLSSKSSSSITLAMPTSAANDHAHFEVWRSTTDTDTGSYTLLADNITASTYSDTGLSDDTQYHYRLIDEDLSGNRSTLGSNFSETTDVAGVWPLLTWDDVGHTGSLTTYSGPTTITADGTTIEDKHITSRLFINANNVTIRNSWMEVGGNSRAIEHCNSETPNNSNLLIEDSTLTGSTNALIMTCGGITVRGSRMRDAAQDLMKINGSKGTVLIEGSYFEGLGAADPEINHQHPDGFQIVMTSAHQQTYRGNTFNTPNAPSLPVPSGGYLEGRFGVGTLTRPVARPLFWGDQQPTGHDLQQVLVEYNWILGGQTAVTVDPNTVQAANMKVQNNKIGLLFYDPIWSGAMSRCGNTWIETGVIDSPDIQPGDFWYSPDKTVNTQWQAGTLLPGESACP